MLCKLNVLARIAQTVQRGTSEEVRTQYADAVRRMALASMRSARLARELESSAAAEKHLLHEKRELEVRNLRGGASVPQCVALQYYILNVPLSSM